MSTAAALSVAPCWTLGSALQRFLGVVRGAPGTVENHRLYARYLCDYFGDRPVSDFAGARGAALVAGYLDHETGGGNRGLRARFGGRGNLVAVLSYSAISQRLATLKEALRCALYVGELEAMPEPWPVAFQKAPERAGMEKPPERKQRVPMTVRATGADQEPAAGGITLASAFDWMLRHGLRRRAEATVALHTDHRRWLITFFGDRALADFEGPSGYRLLTEYVEAEAARGLSFSTMKKRLNTLRLALREAHRRGAIGGLPPWPDMPADSRPRKRWLTYDEYRTVRAALPERARLWIDIAVWTGMHSSDVNRITWAMVDLGAGPGAGPGAGAGFWARTNTKNRKDAVWLPLPDELRAHLSDAWGRQSTAPAADEPIAGTVEKSNFRKLIKRACWEAKISPFSPIDCRHTCVTWWIDRGGPVDGLKLWLGHSARSEMIQRYYLSVTPAMTGGGVDALNRMANEPRLLGPVVATSKAVA